MRSLKILTIGIILFLPVFCSGQYRDGIYDLTFLSRLPCARAEAMGKAYSSIDGDLTSAFFNPAGTATIKGLEINGSIAAPYYLFEQAKFSYISSGYKINNYLILGLSWNYFNSGLNVTQTDDLGNITGSYSPYNSNLSLTASFQPIKNLFLGFNANLFSFYFGQDKNYSPYFDFGIIKKFQLHQNPNSDHSLNLGASIINFSFAKAKYIINGIEYNEDFPVITRYGVTYKYYLDKHWLYDSLKTFRFIAQAEYQWLINSDYHSGLHTGAELLLFEILSLRVGYYKEKVDDHGNPKYNNNNIHSLTYGIGLQIPLNKLTKLPLNINFDYTSLPQPSYIKTESHWDNFTSYNLRLNWMIKNIK